MTHQVYCKGSASYSVQTAIALILFILGLMLLVIWAILYSNRLSNNLSPEWWIWFFLGFGVALMLIGLVWLIIVQYMVGSRAQEMYEHMCDMEKELGLHHDHDPVHVEVHTDSGRYTPSGRQTPAVAVRRV